MPTFESINYDSKNDYYKLFNVSHTANDSEIKKSYYKLAMKHHPDKQSGDEHMFKKINNAYDVLKDK